MGNTQEEATVLAPARLAALCASTPRTIVNTLNAVRRAIVAFAYSTLAAVRALRDRAAQMSRALPGRTKAIAAAAAVLAVAVTAIAAVGPASPATTDSGRPAAHVPAAHVPAAHAQAAHAQVAHAQTARVAATGRQGGPVVAAAPRHSAQAQAPRNQARASGQRHAASAVAVHRHPAGRHLRWVLALNNWHAITEAAAGHPAGGPLTPAQQLLPAPLAGAQATMPITPGRAASAALITAQALRLHMGIRSAVIAVATAMQESTLENLNYGDRDSLGLFQQRPSAGWGTPAQITDPIYAADAFLSALRAYQAADPAWATQPLWRAAQNVQGSAFPYAYAQWEDQAAQVVAAATRHLL
jgi:hypothetical protein